MAEALIAQLGLDLGGFTSALQQAQQQMQAFAQAVAQQLNAATSALNQFTTALGRATQGQQATGQAAQQVNQAFNTYNNTLNQTTNNLSQTNQAFTAYSATLNQTMQTLNQFASVGNTVNTTLINITNNAGNAQRGLSLFGGAIWQIAAGIGLATTLRGIVSALVNFGIESVKTAANMQALTISFQAVAGGAVGAQRSLGELRTLASQMGIDFLTLATNFRNFSAAAAGTKLTSGDIKTLFEGLSAAIRVLGVSGNDAQRVFQAVDRMMQTNVINARELRLQFGTSLPGGLEVFSRAMGVSVKQMFEMTKAGEILAEEELPRVGRQLLSEFGGKAEQAADQANASFARFANNMRDLSITVGNSILTLLKPILDTVNAAADKIGGIRHVGQDAAIAVAQAQGVDITKLTTAQLQELTDAYRRTQRTTGSRLGPGLTGEPLGGVQSPMERFRQEAQVERQRDFSIMVEQLKTQQEITKAKEQQATADAASRREVENTEKAQKRIQELLNSLNVGGKYAPVENAYTKLFEAAGAQFGVDPGLLSRIARQESRFDPNARSKAGALGLMQVLPDTAKPYGVDAAGLLDPQKNIETGAHYFADLLRAYAQFADSTRLALAAYNAGPGNVNDAIGRARAKGISDPSFADISSLLISRKTGKPLTETQAYVPSVLGAGGPLTGSNIQFGSSLSTPLEKAKEEAKAMQKVVDEIRETLEKQPQAEAKIQPELKARLNLLEEELKKKYAMIEAIQKEPQELRKSLQEVITIRRQQATDEEANQTAIFQLQQQGLKSHVADYQQAYSNQVDAAEAAFQKEKAAMEERYHTEKDVDDLIAAERAKLDALADDMRAKQQEKEQAFADFRAKLQAQETKSRADDFQANLDKQLKAFADQGIAESELDKARTDGALAKQRIINEETQKELDKTRKAYEKLVEDIAKPIASVFENILNHTGNVLDTIKQMFTRFLADLAAEAIAKQIVIYFGASLLGSSAGGGGGGVAGAASGGGVGQAFSAASTVAGGASTGDVFGSAASLVGLGGKSGIFKNILNTPVNNLFGGGSYSGPIGPTESGAPLGSSATVGEALGGIGVGMVIGSVTNTFIYGKNQTKAEEIGGLVGGVVGGAIGTAILPGIGSIIGAFLGELIGAFAGSLFGAKRPDPQLKFTDLTTPVVSYDQRFGLQLATPFHISGEKLKDVGAVGIQGTGKYGGGQLEEFNLQLENSFNGLIQKTLNDFRGAAPQIQEALVAPLNAEFNKLTDSIKGYQFHGSQLTNYVDDLFNNVLPTQLARDLQPLTEAVQRINPIVVRFNEIIKQANEDIVKLQQAAIQQHLSLQTSIVGIQEGLYSPAQQYVARQRQLQQALGLLGQATPQQQTILIPQIQQLTQDIFGLAKNTEVLGQDPQALRNLQAQLTSILQGLQGTSAGAFSSLANTEQQQANLAQQQITALVATLSNPTDKGNITSAISTALDQLTAINNVLAGTSPTAQSDATAQVQTALLTGSVQALSSIDQTEQQALAVLQQIAQALAGAPGHQAGIAYVPYTGIAMLHQGERVLTAQENASGGGGGSIVINIQGGGNADAMVDTIIRKIEQKGGRLQGGKIMVRN